MTRRAALRRAMLLATATALASSTKVLFGQNGSLRVPLDQWHDVTFEFKGQRVVVPMAEIFAAVQSGAK